MFNFGGIVSWVFLMDRLLRTFWGNKGKFSSFYLNGLKYFPYDPNKFSNCLKAHSYKIYKMLSGR